jgi:uncharacterized protein with PIN domain
LVSRSGSNSLPVLHELMERAGIVVVPFEQPIAEAAFDAFKLFGKGQGHKAQLNIMCGLRTRQDARPALAIQGQ